MMMMGAGRSSRRRNRSSRVVKTTRASLAAFATYAFAIALLPEPSVQYYYDDDDYIDDDGGYSGGGANDDDYNCSDKLSLYDAFIYLSIITLPVCVALMYLRRYKAVTPRQELWVTRYLLGWCLVSFILMIFLMVDIPGFTCFKNYEVLRSADPYISVSEYNNAVRAFHAARYCAVSSFVAAVVNLLDYCDFPASVRLKRPPKNTGRTLILSAAGVAPRPAAVSGNAVQPLMQQQPIQQPMTMRQPVQQSMQQQPIKEPMQPVQQSAAQPIQEPMQSVVHQSSMQPIQEPAMQPVQQQQPMQELMQQPIQQYPVQQHQHQPAMQSAVVQQQYYPEYPAPGGNGIPVAVADPQYQYYQQQYQYQQQMAPFDYSPVMVYQQQP